MKEIDINNIYPMVKEVRPATLSEYNYLITKEKDWYILMVTSPTIGLFAYNPKLIIGYAPGLKK